jgi:hypothetical protein
MITTKFTVKKQTRQRVEASYRVRLAVDEIKLQKNMGSHEVYSELATQWRDLQREIDQLRLIAEHSETMTYGTRSETKRHMKLTALTTRLAWDYADAIMRAWFAEPYLQTRIKTIQTQQIKIIVRVRAHNAAAIVDKRRTAKRKQEAEQRALAEGKFWECESKTLKNYFRVPFDSRALVEVSERWRAALFVETESENCSNQRGTYWHRSLDTGRGYLCGIDDNGDEWGFHVAAGFSDTVESAVAEVFGVSSDKIKNCYRQGEILFCPAKPITEPIIVCRFCGAKWTPRVELSNDPEDPRPTYHCTGCGTWWIGDYDMPTLHPPVFTATEKWQIVEGHEAWSPGLETNNRWIRSSHEITVTHPTHEMLVLPAGSYRMYVHVENAD